jgi:sugar O-acyltransferase (sialic acid O-acetyltransferase NeuD family)
MPKAAMPKILVIHGATRLSDIVISYLSHAYDQIYKYVDQDAIEKQDLLQTETTRHTQIISNLSSIIDNASIDYISSIGYRNMGARKAAYERMLMHDTLNPINIIHPSAYLAPDAEIGLGNIIFPGATIENGVRIGNNNIIWSNTCICHDAKIGSHNFLAASSTIGGFATIGDCSFLGFGSIVNQELSLCNFSFLASGSVLTKSINNERTRVCGIPAMPMKDDNGSSLTGDLS